MNIGQSIRHATALIVSAALLSLPQAGRCQEEEIEPEVAVTVAQVEKTTLHTYVTAYGTVETAPAMENTPPAGMRLTVPIAGIVSEVPCYEGLRVEKGVVICKLDSRLARAEVEKARQALSFAEKTYKREKALQASSATSEKKLQEAETQLTAARSDLEAARIDLSLYQVAAPISGTITGLNVGAGESVDAATVVAEIADFTRLVASLRVPAAEAAGLTVGQSVEISTGNDDPPVTGALTALSPMVDPASDTVTAYATLPGDTDLRPGRFVSARIATETHGACLAVPEAGVVKDSEAGWTIAVVKGDRAVHMTVETGFRENGLVEVSAPGLSEGMTVVTTGSYGLPDDTRIRITETTKTEAAR